MTKNYQLNTKINKPVAEVYAAVVSSDILTQYFVSAASGDLIAGTQVIWTWGSYGSSPVTVKSLIKNELIELTINSKEWQKTKEDSYDVLLAFKFEALDENSTMLSISETGWRTDAEGLKGSHDNCGGWQHMAMCLKAHLEYGIDMRE